MGMRLATQIPSRWRSIRLICAWNLSLATQGVIVTASWCAVAVVRGGLGLDNNIRTQCLLAVQRCLSNEQASNYVDHPVAIRFAIWSNIESVGPIYLWREEMADIIVNLFLG